MLFTVIVVVSFLLIIVGLIFKSRQIKRLIRGAYFDKLTRALNRRSWDHVIALLDKARGLPYSQEDIDSDNRMIKIPSSPLTSLWIVVFDLDNFKEVNDRHGHTAGDIVLEDFSQTMQDLLRKGDIFARYGGEEFTALICASENDIHGFLNRLRIAVGELIFNGDQSTFRVTPSIGYVKVDATTPAKNLQDQADRAVYVAKDRGRNEVVFADAA